MSFHFTKAGREKEAITNEIKEAAKTIRIDIALLSIFHKNKKNRKTWALDCYNALNSIREYKKGKSLDHQLVLNILLGQYDHSSDWIDALSSQYPNPSDVRPEDIEGNYTRYCTWLAMLITSEPVDRDWVIEKLDKITC